MLKIVVLNILVETDSGSQVSLLPKHVTRTRICNQSLILQAANSSPIRTFGYKRLSLNFWLRRSFVWQFIVADVPIAILGADAFSHYGLIIDLRRCCLIDGLTKLSAGCSYGPTPAIHSVSLPFSLPEGPIGRRYESGFQFRTSYCTTW